MRFTTLTEGDVQIIFLEGRMDLANSMKTESRLNDMLGEGVLKMILDLEKLEYMSSSGLRVIIAVERSSRTGTGNSCCRTCPSLSRTCSISRGFMTCSLSAKL